MIPPFAITLAPSERFVDRNGVLTPNSGMLFLRALWSRTGQGTGVPMQVDNPVVAAGTTQLDATQLTLDWSEVTTVPANSGVVLSPLKVGQQQIVSNSSGGALKVYPPLSVPDSIAIDALAVNAAYSIPAGKLQVFMLWSLTQVRTFNTLG